MILVHNPFVPEEGKVGEFWTYLEDLVIDGTLDGVSLGVSNYRPQDLEAVFKVARIQPVVNRESQVFPCSKRYLADCRTRVPPIPPRAARVSP